MRCDRFRHGNLKCFFNIRQSIDIWQVSETILFIHYVIRIPPAKLKQLTGKHSTTYLHTLGYILGQMHSNYIGII